MKIELYFYPQCPFCARVINGIDQLGLSENITFKNTILEPEAQRFHYETTGRTTVPCLYIDSKPMFESNDILQWLSINADKIKEN